MFGQLYHQRWRIEEAFKRFKHRLQLECVSGLTQQALLVDVAAKVLADNLAALVCMAVQTERKLQPEDRVCNRAYAAVVMQRWLPRALLILRGGLQGLQGLQESIAHATGLLGKNLVHRVAGRSQPRPARHVKPHPHMACKGQRGLSSVGCRRNPQGPVGAPASNQRPISARSASVIWVALFMGMSFCTTACW